MTPDLLIALRTLRTLEQQWREDARAIDHGWVVVTKPEIMRCADQLADVLTQYEKKIKTDDLLGNTAGAATGTERHAEPTARFEWECAICHARGAQIHYDDMTAETFEALRAAFAQTRLCGRCEMAAMRHDETTR